MEENKRSMIHRTLQDLERCINIGDHVKISEETALLIAGTNSMDFKELIKLRTLLRSNI